MPAFSPKQSSPAVAFTVVVLLIGCGARSSLWAEPQTYAGIVGGLATLSAAASSQLTPQGLNTSLYKPQNGSALNLFGGVHLKNYVGLQANYIFNRNDFSISSSNVVSSAFYEQRRSSSQHALTLDLLIYFRKLDSRVRPYLSAGVGMAHFSSRQQGVVAIGGPAVLPPQQFSSWCPVLRVPVGIDIKLSEHVAFRYTFSEALRHNDISAVMSPPGNAVLKNFQNLFGFAFRF